MPFALILPPIGQGADAPHKSYWAGSVKRGLTPPVSFFAMIGFPPGRNRVLLLTGRRSRGGASFSAPLLLRVSCNKSQPMALVAKEQDSTTGTRTITADWEDENESENR